MRTRSAILRTVTNKQIYLLNIIHLPEREDRYAKLQKELQRQGIEDYKIWPGIRSNFSFNGIREAHQNIVRDAKHRNIPFVIIAEDDIMFLGEGAYDYFTRNIPHVDHFDVYLGGIMWGDILPDNTLQGGWFTGFTLYVMSNKFYDTFLSIRGVGHIDALLRGKGKYFVCNPMVVSQHGGLSDSNGFIVPSYDHMLKGRNLWK